MTMEGITMTTTPSIPQPDSQAPWLNDDHWKVGDEVFWILDSVHRIETMMVDIVSPAEGTVRDPQVSDEDEVFEVAGKFENIRHRGQSCAPCAASLRDVELAAEAARVEFWKDRPSVAAFIRFSQLDDQILWTETEDGTEGAFVPEADVPAWFSEVTAGHLVLPFSPELCLARVWEPIDWPTLLAEHPGELSVLLGSGRTQEHLSWDALVAAFRLIEASGKTAYVDVDIEIAGDGALALVPGAIGSFGFGEHPELVAEVTAVLGGIPFDSFGCWFLY